METPNLLTEKSFKQYSFSSRPGRNLITDVQRSPWLLVKNLKKQNKKQNLCVSNKNIFVRQTLLEETQPPNKEHELLLFFFWHLYK